MRSTHQSHSVILPSDTVSAINSPIKFSHPPLRHGQCDQFTNHILSSSPPTRSVRLTHQSHSLILPSDTVSAINSPITFSHPPLRHGQCDQFTNHILSSSPPTRSVRSTHQSHSSILPSDTVSAINSPITFCHPPLRHGQCGQFTNHILSSSPPTRSVRSTHQSHSAILPSDTVSAINSPITFCHPPLRHGQCDQFTNHILSSSPPTRSVRLTHQSHSLILPSDTVSAINSPITFSHPPLRHGQCDQFTNHILSSSPPTRSVRSTHQSHSAVSALSRPCLVGHTVFLSTM